jgi:hypothetical protein
VKTPLTVILLIAGIALGSCGPREIADRRRMVLESWGTTVLLPLQREFEARAAALSEAAHHLCQQPDAARLEAARAAWWAARAPWKQMEVFAFGPYKDEPLRLGPKIDFWPARRETVEAILAGDQPLTAAAVQRLGAPARGLPAIEVLLHAGDDLLLERFHAEARRCPYLVALTEDLAARATELREAWDPDHGNFLGELTEAGRGSASFDTLHLALGEVVNRMAFTVENIRADKLGRPLGSEAGTEPRPDSVESRFSGRSLEDIRDNLRGIERLYFGAPAAGAAAPADRRPGGATDEAIGLDFYLRARGRNFAPRMRARLDAAYAAIDAIDMPLVQALAAQPILVQDAMDRLTELQRLIQVDIINALSLTASFNDNDGD